MLLLLLIQFTQDTKVRKVSPGMLTNTLIPLVVLNVSLWAAAPIAAQDVLAAMLAPVVPVTFVNICKDNPGVVFTVPCSMRPKHSL